VREALILNSLGLGDQIGAAAYLGTDASNDAPVAEGTFPLLLFSPGFGSPFENYQVFAEQLASYGYVVVGVNHPGISGPLSLDGDTYPAFGDFPVEKADSLNQLTIDDLQAVLSQLQDGRALPSLALGRSIDLNRVGAFGHSFGGSAAIRWAARNRTVRAAVDLDGTIWGDELNQELKARAMIVRTQVSARYDNSMETAWKNFKQKSLLVTMPQPEHPTFGDFYYVTKVVAGSGADAPEAGYGQNAPANIAFVRNLLVNYFDVTLKGFSELRVNHYLTVSAGRGYVTSFKYNE
jgi:pimeloyl-ACP methyl ester carboxylesterase